MVLVLSMLAAASCKERWSCPDQFPRCSGSTAGPFPVERIVRAKVQLGDGAIRPVLAIVTKPTYYANNDPATDTAYMFNRRELGYPSGAAPGVSKTYVIDDDGDSLPNSVIWRLTYGDRVTLEDPAAEVLARARRGEELVIALGDGENLHAPLVEVSWPMTMKSFRGLLNRLEEGASR